LPAGDGIGATTQTTAPYQRFPFTHPGWATLVVKMDEAPDPLDVALLGTQAVMPGAYFRAYLIQ
jgi:hypothetical protein